MKKIMLMSLLTVGMGTNAATYIGTIVTMSADPDITWDEKPHKYTALKLNSPKNIRGQSIDDKSGKLFLNVIYMQLVDGKQLAIRYKNKGNVKVTCSEVYVAHTGYHYTDLLCSVSGVKVTR